MQNVSLLLKEWDSFMVDVPEVKLLSQYYKDAVSWVSNFNCALETTREWEDQHNVADELKSILEDGLSLKIQGDSVFGLPALHSLGLYSHTFVYYLVNSFRLNGFTLQLMSCH